MNLDLNIRGWAAAVIALVLLGVVGIRLMTFDDMKNDDALMRDLQVQLTAEYLPDEVERLRTAYESGDQDLLENVAGSVASNEVDIRSVHASSPLLDFSSSMEVVVKVDYTLSDAGGVRKEETKYYLYEHGTLPDSWSFRYESNPVSYYLNFI